MQHWNFRGRRGHRLAVGSARRHEVVAFKARRDGIPGHIRNVGEVVEELNENAAELRDLR